MRYLVTHLDKAWMLTVIHLRLSLIPVVLGLLILGFLLLKTLRGGYSAEDHLGMETGASYWHMVDLVWIVLFPLVYVMR